MRRHPRRAIAAMLAALALALSAPCLAAAEAPVVISDVAVVTGPADDNDALFDRYVADLFSAPRRTRLASRSVGERLTGNDGAVYGALKAQIAKIAAGARASASIDVTKAQLAKTWWTASELGVGAITSNGAITSAAKSALLSALFDLSRVHRALLADCPYELYWYDKTRGVSVSMSYGLKTGTRGGAQTLELSACTITFQFTVASGYAGGDAYTVNTARARRATAAVENARGIVAEYAPFSDAYKLERYKSRICDLTSYNHAAVNSNAAYGDPWQLVYVFDGDEATSVVCEGYSKAFQYLCDLSDFEGNVSAVSVTGTMSAGASGGPHMWNIATMPDGYRYLVDVTNCDSGFVGSPDRLFLRGYAFGNPADGYVYACGSTRVTYKYDDAVYGLFSEADLTLSGADYAASPHLTVTIRETGAPEDGAAYAQGETVACEVTVTNDGGEALTDVRLEANGQSREIGWLASFAAQTFELSRAVTLEEALGGGVALTARATATAASVGALESEAAPQIAARYAVLPDDLALPDALTAIPEGAFAGTAVAAVRVGGHVTRIGARAFANCESLRQIRIPANVTVIAGDAFDGCGDFAIICPSGSAAEAFAQKNHIPTLIE